jgi:threonylcarbamoyladenosine tRNA methylthiotransferase MtaB
MPQVAGAAVRARAARLRAAGEAAEQRHLAGQLGREHRVLMETARTGRTEQFAEVLFDSDQRVGAIAAARITGLDGRQLLATSA